MLYTSPAANGAVPLVMMFNVPAAAKVPTILSESLLPVWLLSSLRVVVEPATSVRLLDKVIPPTEVPKPGDTVPELVTKVLPTMVPKPCNVSLRCWLRRPKH